jgi:hypothetical protein
MQMKPSPFEPQSTKSAGKWGRASSKLFTRNVWPWSSESDPSPFVANPAINLAYKQRPISRTYSPDFLCYGKIIVELKSARDLAPEHGAQIINYLRATGLRVGLLVNFRWRQRRASNDSSCDRKRRGKFMSVVSVVQKPYGLGARPWDLADWGSFGSMAVAAAMSASPLSFCFRSSSARPRP